MRGEHTLLSSGLMAVTGSSPHARGTLPHSGGRTQHYGIIPACAGNTSLCVLSIFLVGDHPRMRGEHPNS